MKDKNKFTIGDRTNNGTISKFEVDTYGIRVFFEDKPKNYHVSLNSIHHIKKPLFTTEDGVDIFEGDKVYECGRYGYPYNKPHKFTPLNSRKHNYNSIGKDWTVFSTEEKAEEYIFLNTPCLSLKDISTIKCSEYDFFGAIKKLVEEKIK